MKNVRWMVLGLALATGLVATAQADDKKDAAELAILMGKWEPAKKAGIVIDLQKDGKLVITATGGEGGKEVIKMEGTYTYAGGKLKVDFKTPDGTQRKQTLTVKSLGKDAMVTVDEKDKEEEMKRVK